MGALWGSPEIWDPFPGLVAQELWHVGVYIEALKFVETSMCFRFRAAIGFASFSRFLV